MSTARALLLAALCSSGFALAQTPFPSKPVSESQRLARVIRQSGAKLE